MKLLRAVLVRRNGWMQSFVRFARSAFLYAGEIMPYKRDGNKVLHFKGGKWSVKQVCKSAANAAAAIRLLYAKEKKG
ncbi:MAG: hypothetical protein PHC68_00340 [Syntrophorhabdaceae bacterium]|nr:hypothetical protein [Syntrophorhabdaceae bacterium]